MNALGFTILGNDPTHPICPVLLGDARLASTMADEMLKKGIYVIGFSYPVVPKGKARIRVQVSFFDLLYLFVSDFSCPYPGTHR